MTFLTEDFALLARGLPKALKLFCADLHIVGSNGSVQKYLVVYCQEQMYLTLQVTLCLGEISPSFPVVSNELALFSDPLLGLIRWKFG